MLHDEVELCSGKGAAGANGVEHKKCPTERHHIIDEDMSIREVKPIVKHLVANELSILIEELLDRILHNSFQEAKIVIRSVLYKVAELVTLELLGMG